MFKNNLSKSRNFTTQQIKDIKSGNRIIFYLNLKKSINILNGKINNNIIET
jgi:hypothetical protein